MTARKISVHAVSDKCSDVIIWLETDVAYTAWSHLLIYYEPWFVSNLRLMNICMFVHNTAKKAVVTCK